MKPLRSVLFAALALLTACGGSRQAVGDVDSVIVIAHDSLWAAVGDSFMAALEPRVFTVRDERTFKVTHVSPAAENWHEMRKFRQVLTIGAAGDAWVAPVLEAADLQQPSPPALVRARDVWARNQFATALVLGSSTDADAALAESGRVAAVIDSVFRVYARQRMYTSEPDTATRDSLLASRGFGILLPNVYSTVAAAPGISLYQNSTQVGGDLIRSVLVAERPGVQPLTPEQVLAWRDSLAATVYSPPQITLREQVTSRTVTSGGANAVEVQGVWRGTDPTWPSSGPFIARAYACPSQDRTFLVDTWLFAPSRSKYEYMIQLQTILDTFQCGEQGAER